MSNSLLDDLEWRGLIAQSTDRKELESALAKPISLYLGVDPTAPSMHLGNLVVFLVLKRFQLAGHRPIALVGGATGLVGDPSGKNDERTLNEEKLVAEWVAKIRKQVEKILDFKDKDTSAKLVNNLDWTKSVSALELLRDIGKHFSVNQMLAKDSVATRLSSTGISYTEFSYQVLQAFDYLELYRRDQCKLQIGGSDQWGNIVAGLDLIRKVEGGSAHALTVPLLAKSDGSKFGKTASGAIWLEESMTSAYEFFQFWLNSDDADMPKLLKVFSMKSRAEIEELIEKVKTNPGAREAHRELAREMTTLIHGSAMAKSVEEAAKALFGQGEIGDLDLKTLDSALSQLPKTIIKKGDPYPTWVDLLAATGVVDSKSAARRIVKEGGGYLNNKKVESEDFTPSKADLLHGKYLLLRKGKRDLAAVEVEG
ncbi:tyrosine--tRNA ligase [Candidatus Planktophila sp.]|nr:tyrosine--tRNA ligase [Candidatus Planktophila sp.]